MSASMHVHACTCMCAYVSVHTRAAWSSASSNRAPNIQIIGDLTASTNVVAGVATALIITGVKGAYINYYYFYSYQIIF